MTRNVNAHSFIYNPHYYKRQNAATLEDLIGKFRLFINNKLGHATQLLNKEVLIIDFIFFLV